MLEKNGLQNPKDSGGYDGWVPIPLAMVRHFLQYFSSAWWYSTGPLVRIYAIRN